jgi:hypothetical protein
MIGYFKNNRYENIYGTPIKCFKCEENKCNGSKFFSFRFGGHGELIHCEKHEQDAQIEADKRSESTTNFNIKTSST